MFIGEIPSLTLKKVFDKFKKRMLGIYRQVKASIGL
jgi:hypothetical protein